MRWFFGWFKISLPGLLAGGLALVSTSALALDIKAWEESINPETKERYIPVELWPGAEWDGKRELRMPKVDGTYSHRTATYQVKGPTEWKHPVTGKVFVVYERINPGKDGDKSQIFTINDHQTGLGRLFDGRPGRGYENLLRRAQVSARTLERRRVEVVRIQGLGHQRDTEDRNHYHQTN